MFIASTRKTFIKAFLNIIKIVESIINLFIITYHRLKFKQAYHTQKII
jgi:hypothetical protein